MLKNIYLPEDVVLEEGRKAIKEFADRNDFSIQTGFATDLLSKHLEPNEEETLGIIVLNTQFKKEVESVVQLYPKTYVVVLADVEFGFEPYEYFLHFKKEDELAHYFKIDIYTKEKLKVHLDVPAFLLVDSDGTKPSAPDDSQVAEGLSTTRNKERIEDEPHDRSSQDTEADDEEIDSGEKDADRTNETVSHTEVPSKGEVTKPPKPIQRKGSDNDIFGGGELKLQMRIGVWSPLHRTGVSTFIQSFAFYLAENQYNIVVLESLTKKFKLINFLLRCSTKPTGWSSLVNAVNGEAEYKSAKWVSEGVFFMPVDSSHTKYEWTEDTVTEYYKIHPNVQVQLVDIPSGDLLKSEEMVFAHLDELWILADDSYHEMATWKNVIEDYKKKYKLPTQIIFNKRQDHSKPKLVAKELSLPLLTSIPDMHKEVTLNYYLKIPLYFMDDVQEKYAESFTEILEHIKKQALIKQNGRQHVKTGKIKRWTTRFLKAITD